MEEAAEVVPTRWCRHHLVPTAARAACCPLPSPGSGQLWLGSGKLGLLHVEVQSVLQIDVEVEEPETSENPTQSF